MAVLPGTLCYHSPAFSMALGEKKHLQNVETKFKFLIFAMGLEVPSVQGFAASVREVQNCVNRSSPFLSIFPSGTFQFLLHMGRPWGQCRFQLPANTGITCVYITKFNYSDRKTTRQSHEKQEFLGALGVLLPLERAGATKTDYPNIKKYPGKLSSYLDFWCFYGT